MLNRHDYWTSRRDEAVTLASCASSPLGQAVYGAYLEFAIAEVRGVER